MKYIQALENIDDYFHHRHYHYYHVELDGNLRKERLNKNNNRILLYYRLYYCYLIYYDSHHIYELVWNPNVELKNVSLSNHHKQ
jgi:hypothetical protein